MDIASRSRMSVPARWQSDGNTTEWYQDGLTMLKHPRIGRHSSSIRSGACLASTSRRLQKEAPNSGYRVTESDEGHGSVI